MRCGSAALPLPLLLLLMKLLLGTLRGGSARRATLLSGSRRGVSICTVDAFALQGPRPFSGNPAAVCVLPQQQGQGQPPPDEDWMQSVALEMNLSETAFLERRGEARYGLRWFTPTDEVDLCGHATLASSHAIWANAHSPPTATLTFETRSGELHATPTEGGWIELDFPSEAGRGEIVPVRAVCQCRPRWLAVRHVCGSSSLADCGYG
jgi:predicted PhzF superfamily epimerase YddE/YHI9